MEIFYTGIGSNKSGIHTETDFLKIMTKEFTYNTKMHDYQLQFKDWKLPDDFIFFTLDDWLDYSGASYH
jgi:hypothetical protein